MAMVKDPGRPELNGYLCGQCFMQHQQNDVLFGADRFCTSCDMRQAAHRYAFASPEKYEAWCREGKSRVLLDWEDLPASHRKIEQGVLQQVQDNTGVWCARRVCPSCHSVLEDFRGMLLAGWNAQGLDMLWAASLLQQGGWESLLPKEDVRDNALEYARFLHKGLGVFLAVPVGLRQGGRSYAAACVKRCGPNAACAVLRLDLSGIADLQPQEQIEAGTAQDTLSGFLEFAGYVGQQLTLPTAVLIDGIAAGANDAGEQLQQHAAQLFNRLQICLKHPLLVGWDQRAATARRIGDWLANRVSLRDQ